MDSGSRRYRGSAGTTNVLGSVIRDFPPVHRPGDKA